MINKFIEKYIEDHTSDEDELLYKINRQTNLRTTMPRMLSGKVQGKFLELISMLMEPKLILEIGTFTGYSALCLAKGLHRDGKLISIESNEEFKDTILNYFAQSETGQKIELIIGDALEEIKKLDHVFDLVFIDANKEEYLDYYKLIKPKVKSGGVIIVDNVLWSGKVLDEITDNETEALKQFNNHIKNDTTVDKVMLSVRDGLYMISKR